MIERKFYRTNKHKQIIVYICYWLFFMLVFTAYRYFLLTDKITFSVALLKHSLFPNFFYITATAIVAHLIIEFILPKYYSKDQYIKFSIIISLIALAVPLIGYFFANYFVNVYITGKPSEYTVSHYIATVMKFVFCLTPLVFYKTILHILKKESHEREMETAKLESDLKLKEAELKLLKGQIQPHFLFNTLNNLYSLSLQNSEKTPEVIIKLSDLLNYIIYDCRSEKVKIEDEVDFLKSFIELEQIRHDESLKITVAIEGDYSNLNIAPMLLHTFIENAFKHGANKTTGVAWIDVVLTINDGKLIFRIANSKLHDSNLSTVGIGISNTKKRLNLIYPEKHKLEITETENVYSIYLEIQL